MKKKKLKKRLLKMEKRIRKLELDRLMEDPQYMKIVELMLTGSPVNNSDNAEFVGLDKLIVK